MSSFTNIPSTGTGSGITSLTGDVSASGPGSAVATIISVGGESAANVATATSTVLGTEVANTVFSGPASGSDTAPTFRGLVKADIPNLDPTNVVIVSQTPSVGQFSTVVAALASITTNSSTNPFCILINPGVYTESQIIMKSFVCITARSPQTVTLVPSNSNQAFIIGADNSSLVDLVFFGSTGGSGISVKYSSSSPSSALLLQNCIFGDATTLVYINGNASNETILIMEDCITITDVNFTTGIKVDSTGGIRSRVVATDCFINTGHSISTPTDFLLISGDAAKVFLDSSFFIGPFSSPAGNGIHLSDGADVTILACNFINMAKCIWIENSGVAPAIAISGVHTDSNIIDVQVDHLTATGSIEGAFDPELSIISSPFVSIFFLEPTGGVSFTGRLSIGDTFNDRTDVTDLILQGPTMGLYTGGDLSSGGGFVVDVTAGTGYLSTGVPASFITWSNTSITLSANVSVYIYFDNTSTLIANNVFPNTQNIILLGRVVTNSSTISLIDDSPVDASHVGNLQDNFLRFALGSVFQYGCLVTENTTPLHLDVTSGSYFFSTSNFLPSAGTNITFIKYYSNGAGGWTTSSASAVDTSSYDNGSGTLASIPSNNYTKASLYINGEGTNKVYSYVYGQAVYTTLVGAQSAPIPLPPSFFIDGVVLIAGIIVKQGTTSIVSGGGQLVDERPRIGFSAPAALTTGTVSSVALSLPSIFTVTGSPVTSSGTLTGSLNSQSQNLFLGSPNGSSGVPSFRAIASADISALAFSSIQNISTQTITGRSTAGTGSQESLTIDTSLTISSGVVSVNN